MKKVHEEEWEHPNGLENHIIMVTIFYDKNTRTYWTSVVPATITKSSGFSMREFGAFTGFKFKVLEGISRQSAKHLETCKQVVTSRKEEFVSKFKDNLIET